MPTQKVKGKKNTAHILKCVKFQDGADDTPNQHFQDRTNKIVLWRSQANRAK